jgi:hypothetical protein
MKSDFGNRDGPLRANLDAGLATQALIGLYRLGLAVNQLIYLRGARVYTLFIANTFILINYDLPHDVNLLTELINNGHVTSFAPNTNSGNAD